MWFSVSRDSKASRCCKSVRISASRQSYDHFSLLGTLESGFGLPCLNHACDATSLIMNDMFGN